MPDQPNAPYALAVDDDPLILMNTCDILTDAGFRSLEAEDVAAAIGMLEDHAGDITLLFTDVQMPGDRNGFDLARETHGRWPDIRILVASGQINPKDNELPDGAVFVSKPFSAEVVHARLQELLPDGQKPEPLKRRAAS
jgi:CheY-like chemotaxis protein